MDFDFVAIATIVGALLPLVISFFKQATWPNQTKKVFAMVVSVLAAVVMTGSVEGWSSLNWSSLIASSGVIIALAQSTYLGFWEDGPVESRVATLLYK